MGGKKILVVDDDPELVKLVKMRLAAHGFDVVGAHDGVEGIEKAELERPDLILLDIKMPEVDGHTALRNLKHRTSTRDIPVIILTAYDKLKDLFELEGAKDYIVKPFEDQDLLLRITRALK